MAITYYLFIERGATTSEVYLKLETAANTDMEPNQVVGKGREKVKVFISLLQWLGFTQVCFLQVFLSAFLWRVGM